MNCCACNGSCNHVGPHSYCAAHGGGLNGGTVTITAPNTANPYFDEAQAEKLRREYERGRADGYKDAVKQIRLATRALKKK